MQFRLENIRILELEITSHCNSFCPHCPRFDSDLNLISSMQLKHWNWKKIKYNLELDQLINLKQVIIRGDKGEPLMHPNLEEIVDFFLGGSSQPEVLIGTNGSVRNTEWWGRLGSKSKRLVVDFSIDGLDDTNEIYRVGTNYKKIIKNASAFIQAGGRANWRCLIFKHNQHQIQEIKQFAKQLGFAQVTFYQSLLNRFLGKTVWPVFKNGKELPSLSPTDFDQKFISMHNKTWTTDTIAYDNNDANFVCPRMQAGNIYITYRHHVVPCCMMHNVLYEGKSSKSFRRIMELLKDADQLDLEKLSLRNILLGDFWAKSLHEHFFNGAFHPICAASCKSEILSSISRRSL